MTSHENPYQAWKEYCEIATMGAPGHVVAYYWSRYARIQGEFDAARRQRIQDDARRSSEEAERRHQLAMEEADRWAEFWRAHRAEREGAIVLAAPRRVTSKTVAKLTTHVPFTCMLTSAAILCATAPWGLCLLAAPLVIYIWWLVTRSTIQAATQLDEHPIPPARVLSEGPR